MTRTVITICCVEHCPHFAFQDQVLVPPFFGRHGCGAQADFYINADQIAIGDAPQHENHLRARFLSHKFVGNMVTLFLDVPGIDDDLKVILPERTYDCLGLQPGDSVVASRPAAAAHFFGRAN